MSEPTAMHEDHKAHKDHEFSRRPVNIGDPSEPHPYRRRRFSDMSTSTAPIMTTPITTC
jgi:hypothetical protein